MAAIREANLMNNDTKVFLDTLDIGNIWQNMEAI